MKKPKHDLLSWSDLRDLIIEIEDEYNLDGGDILDMLSYEGDESELNQFLLGVEKWVEDNGLNYYDGWKEFLDENGNLLPQYNQDKFVQMIVDGEGYYDYIKYKTTN